MSKQAGSIYNNYNLYKGRVISAADPDEKGRIQVHILPICTDLKDEDCPWLRPFHGAQSGDTITSIKYVENDLVWCLLDEHENEKYILGSYDISSQFKWEDIDKVLSDVEGLTVSYEHMEFKKYLDGAIVFHNIENGDHGFINSAGSYYFMKNDGEFVMNGNAFTVDGGDFIVNGNLEVKV